MTRRVRAGAAGAALMLILPLAMLGGCGEKGNPLRKDNDANKVTSVQSGVAPATSASLPGTPMAQRVAIIGLLNKRNGLTHDLTMKPGQALRLGSAIVRLRACEQTAPWEDPPETGAFVQLDVQETRDNKWHRIFSGWLFKERPDRNAVQHPIYDVWVKSCAMTWPETGPDTVKASGEGKAGDKSSGTAPKPSSAAKSAAPTSGNPGTAPTTAG
ncbi:MAG: DUF2155 domain-containing protein, partial [Pseudomonadota bacterium]